MKKFYALMISFLVVMAFVAPASAYFDQQPGSLVMTVYDPTGNEQSIDLGQANNMDLAPGTVLWSGTLNATAYTANSSIAIWGLDSDESTDIHYDVYFSSTNPNASAPTWDATIAQNEFVGAMSAVNAAANLGANSNVVLPYSGMYYGYNLNAGRNVPGWMGGTSTDASGEHQLDGLAADSANPVSLYLYRYRTGLNEQGEIVTFLTQLGQVEFDGTSLSISQVPVPGALWLLGSGLIGLVGLRRRQR
jgi:hypothetical protein